MDTHKEQLQGESLWRNRLHNIDSKVEKIELPEVDTSQDTEWCEAVVAGQKRRLRFHDYHEIYKIPGLYEQLFYDNLQCCSPYRVVSLLEEVMQDAGEDMSKLRIFDVGAGNGMVGDEFHSHGAEAVVGVDIIPEAKEATERDRPGVYADYLVTDLTDLPEQDEEKLRKHRFNCLCTVAALGFGDMPSKAFLKSLDLICTPGWMTFNIKEAFLNNEDKTGFCKLIQDLSNEGVIQIQAYRRYQHRLSTNGKPLHYLAMVAKKMKDLPDHFMKD